MENKSSSEPVAIVGIGCRFPGGATTPERFWELLAGGVDTIRDVPPDRFDIEALYSSEAKLPGHIASKSGAFVDDIDKFDAEFFGISTREATFMDPQQRLLLECAVEAVEDAGLSLHRLAGTKAAVYVGSFNSDYEMRMYHQLPRIDLYSVIGGGRYSMANRISYVLDLRGPSMQLDTACSSSMVALEFGVGQHAWWECPGSRENPKRTHYRRTARGWRFACDHPRVRSATLVATATRRSRRCRGPAKGAERRRCPSAAIRGKRPSTPRGVTSVSHEGLVGCSATREQATKNPDHDVSSTMRLAFRWRSIRAMMSGFRMQKQPGCHP